TGNNFFTPCSNLFYGLEDCRNHNTLSPKRYRQFFDQLSAEQKIIISNQPDHLIDLASVRYVLTRSAVFDKTDIKGTASQLPLLSTGRVTPGLRLIAGEISYDKVDSQVVGRLRWKAHANVSDRYALQLTAESKNADGSRSWQWVGPRELLHSSLAERHEVETLVAVPISTSLPPGSPILIFFQLFDTWTGQFVQPDGINIEATENKVALSQLKTEAKSGTLESRRFRLLHESKEQFRIYENLSALPNAYVVGSAKIADGEEQALHMVHKKLFDPRREIVLEASDKKDAISSALSTPENSESIVRIERPSPTEVLIETSMTQSGYLVLTDTNYPGWKAYLDGQEVPILKANYLFRAVSIPEGKHEVRFKYQPGSFMLGLALSAFALLALMFAFVLGWRKREHR
ncbi:MAG: YfhO family protein, partial [Cyanobacteria bacterium]|nr:YfhO family protein [Cyanobacteriota bacterium]